MGALPRPNDQAPRLQTSRSSRLGGVQLSEGAPAFVDRASAAGRRLQRGGLRGSQAVWGAVRSFGTPSRPSRLTPERRAVSVAAQDGRRQAGAPRYCRGVKLRTRRQAARVGGQRSYPNLNRTVEQRRDAAARRFRDVRAPHLTLLTRAARGLKSREVRRRAGTGTSCPPRAANRAAHRPRCSCGSHRQPHLSPRRNCLAATQCAFLHPGAGADARGGERAWSCADVGAGADARDDAGVGAGRRGRGSDDSCLPVQLAPQPAG